MPSRSELKKQFCSITNTSEDVATKYLKGSDWNIQRATNTYLNENRNSNVSKAPQVLQSLYEKYMDTSDPDIISIEGTLQYLEDLGIEPEDPRSLVLAYLLNSPQTGEFTKTSFLDFWSSHRIHSISAMRAYIEKIQQSLIHSPSEFEDFHQYCFCFLRGSDSRIKSISYEDAISYWKLLFAQREDLNASVSRLEQWYQFVQSTARPITRDTWNMFYKFVIDVIQPDPVSLSSYDEMSSWPSMVDEFMEWMHENGFLSQNG